MVLEKEPIQQKPLGFMSLSQDIKNGFTQLNALEKIIAANVIVFVVYSLLMLPGSSLHFFDYFELPSQLSDFITQPWAIVTYGFLHYGFWHLLFNMLWLFVLARFFSNVFDYTIGVKLYFFGVLAGGAFFLLIYNLFPQLGNTKLVGASAGVRALLIFLCAYMPFMEVKVLVIKLKLWHLGAFVVLIDLLNLVANNNFGGNIAHLGGSLVGYIYAMQLQKGKTMGKSFDSAIVSLENLFKAPKNKKTKLKTVHKGSKKVAGYTKEEFKEFNNQKRIDLILDKISKSGYDSLTKDEKEFLFKAGK